MILNIKIDNSCSSRQRIPDKVVLTVFFTPHCHFITISRTTHLNLCSSIKIIFIFNLHSCLLVSVIAFAEPVSCCNSCCICFSQLFQKILIFQFRGIRCTVQECVFYDYSCHSILFRKIVCRKIIIFISIRICLSSRTVFNLCTTIS